VRRILRRHGPPHLLKVDAGRLYFVYERPEVRYVSAEEEGEEEEEEEGEGRGRFNLMTARRGSPTP